MFDKDKSDKRKKQKTNDKYKKMEIALFSYSKTVGNRNPQSRGQGISGENKVAILNLLNTDD